jgi:kumamolisin
MSSPLRRIPLSGSFRGVLAGSRQIGEPHPDQRIEVTVRLRASGPFPDGLWRDFSGSRPPGERRYLSREQLAAAYGSAPDDIGRVTAFARAHQLAVVETSEARKSLWLSGTISAMSEAFGVVLHEYAHPGGGTFRGRIGPIVIPANLEGIVQGVFGLDTRPQATPAALAAARSPLGVSPRQVARACRFPEWSDGSGETIGIIAVAGGFHHADIAAYFASLGLPTPVITSVSVDGASHIPSPRSDGQADRVMTEIQTAGAIAPAARIVVYIAPNTAQGVLDGVTCAIHDAVNRPSVVVFGWAERESAWTRQSIEQLDRAFQDASALGVTICAAAGHGGTANVDSILGTYSSVYPGSSPHVLSCASLSSRSPELDPTHGEAAAWAALIALLNQCLRTPVGYLNAILDSQSASPELSLEPGTDEKQPAVGAGGVAGRPYTLLDAPKLLEALLR